MDGGRGRAYVLTDLIGPVAAGDRVVVNTTAVDLGLGSGGWHFVHWNLARGEWSSPGGGHVLKLRYTSLQADTGATEESGADLGVDLAGMPVVVCDLHSQVGCVAAAFAATAPGRRLVYVMTDSAALPLALSEVVHRLKESGGLAATVSCGQAFGGDHEAVNPTSGLLVARGAAAADAVVVGPGPGVVGTRTRFGFSGLEGAAVLDAAERLGGAPVVCVRWSGADGRDEHRGVSHHTLTVLEQARSRARVAVPAGEQAPPAAAGHDVVEVDLPREAMAAVEAVAVTTMGRSPADDPGFFRWAATAGVVAARLLSPG